VDNKTKFDNFLNMLLHILECDNDKCCDLKVSGPAARYDLLGGNSSTSKEFAMHYDNMSEHIINAHYGNGTLNGIRIIHDFHYALNANYIGQNYQAFSDSAKRTITRFSH
jgi:hypothetical protein